MEEQWSGWHPSVAWAAMCLVDIPLLQGVADQGPRGVIGTEYLFWARYQHALSTSHGHAKGVLQTK